MAFSEVQPFDDSHPLDAQQLKATKRGVVVGAIGFPFFAYKSHTSQGVVLESNADLIGFAIGAASDEQRYFTGVDGIDRYRSAWPRAPAVGAASGEQDVIL